MSGLYIDTSALGRVLLGEPDADVIRATIDRYDEQWSSELLTVELGRLAKLRALQPEADKWMEDVHLVRVTSRRLRSASTIEPDHVRALDSIHLDAAVLLHQRGTIDAVLTFDIQLQAGCQHHGIRIEAPTVESPLPE